MYKGGGGEGGEGGRRGRGKEGKERRGGVFEAGGGGDKIVTQTSCT